MKCEKQNKINLSHFENGCVFIRVFSCELTTARTFKSYLTLNIQWHHIHSHGIKYRYITCGSIQKTHHSYKTTKHPRCWKVFKLIQIIDDILNICISPLKIDCNLRRLLSKQTNIILMNLHYLGHFSLSSLSGSTTYTLCLEIRT